MALSMRTKIILPVAAAAVAGIAALVIALSGGGSQNAAPIPTSTVTRPSPTATIEQKLTPTITPTSGQKVSETAECDWINVVYKINGKVQWKFPIATEADVADGYAFGQNRFICGPDVEPIVGEDYVAAVGVDRLGFKGKITFRNKQGKEIFGYFHDGPFTDLVKIPGVSSGEPIKDYVLFLAQNHNSLYAGKAREKTGDNNIVRVPQIGVLGVDTDGEVYALADRAVFFGLDEGKPLDPKTCVKSGLQETGQVGLYYCVGEASDLTFKRDGNTVNLSFELSTASGTRQVSTTLADLLENPVENRYVPLVE